MGFRANRIGLMVLWLSAACCPSRAFGDGGTLRFWDRLEGYEIAVFTSPSPFVAGPVDISVLVLDSESGSPVLDASVDIELTPIGRPGVGVHHP
ncbi:hypothetical protein ACYOEI_42100, partial [Singulisphaera rosea]